MDYTDSCEAVLIAALATTTTTGVTAKIKQVNGTYPTWPTGAHQLVIRQKTRVSNKIEKINVAAGSSQTAAGVVTLGTLTRKISLTDGSDVTGTGTAQSFTAGAQVIITWTASDAELTVKKNETNTLTGDGAIRSSSTTTPVIRINNVTEAQRDLMTAANGDIVYNTDTGVLNQYVGGAWVAVGDAGTPTATESAEGKVELATAAEHDPSTTGAKVVQAANVVKTSSGAGDENKIACLNASGQFASGFMPAASTKTLHVLKDASTNPTAFNSSTAEIDLTGGDSQYTLPANELSVNTAIRIRASFVVVRGGTGDPGIYLYVGGTKRGVFGKYILTTATHRLQAEIWLTCITSGASGVMTQNGFSISDVAGAADTAVSVYPYIASGGGVPANFSIDTTATNLIKFAGQWSGSQATNAITLVEFNIAKFKV
jgi:hypothetical protein